MLDHFREHSVPLRRAQAMTDDELADKIIVGEFTRRRA
jgi:hypothetical protein